MNHYLVLALCVLTLNACKPAPSDSVKSDDGKLQIVATTSMIADLAVSLAGDRAEIKGLMGPGIDPHAYKPSPSDITALQNADLILYNGLHLEGKMGELFDRLSANGKPVTAVTKDLPKGQLISPENEDYPDPHVWGDVGLWARVIPTVVEALSAADPEGSEVYTENGAALTKEYTELDAWVRDNLHTITRDRRFLITSHDAFAYLGRAYGVTVIGIQGISTVSEAGLAEMAIVTDLIKERDIPAIFVETSTSDATIKRIAEDTGVKIGGALFSDAMGNPGDLITVDGVEYDEGTYPGMIVSNIDTITKALSE